MPIIKPTNSTAPVIYPSGNYSIAKYMDLTKFISLLQRQALFFCRLDQLEDKFEGTTAKLNYQFRINSYHYLRDIGFYQVVMSDEEIEQKVREDYEFDNKLKAISCVDCWNKKDTESAALWKVYSDFSKGIMIKSSINNLVSSLELSVDDIMLSEIKYIDFNKELMYEGNSNYLLIHKHNVYSYEDEVRLIYIKMPETGFIYDWSKEEVYEGVYIKANLDRLIEEIVISPYSPKWFFKLIQNVSNKYGLNKPINRSELSID